MKKILTSLAVVSFLFVGNAVAIPVTPVDLELQLLVDVSGSVNTNEFNLQRSGYADTFKSTDIHNAIASGTHGSIAAQLIYWSGPSEQSIAVDWFLLDSAASSTAFGDAILAAGRPFGGLTAIGSAINYGSPLFGTNDYDGTRWVIDVSGDGSTNSGDSTSAARDAALLAGVDTINGLVIGGSSSVFDHYQNNVIGGTDAFVVTAAGFDDFGDAVYDKIYSEITETPPQVPEPNSWMLMGTGVIGLIGYMRRRKA